MRFVTLAILALIVATLVASPALHARQESADWAAYVDPFIGTAPAPSAAYGQEFDAGDVFPGAAYPAGMLYWSPDTAEHNVPGGYFYPDRTIKGFSLTHFSGRGCTVYLDVPIMPLLGPLADGLQPSSFSHTNESASPGAYSVLLDNGIGVDLAVTPRTGLGRITWPSSTPVGTIVVNAAGSVNGTSGAFVSIDPERQLVTGRVTSQVGCGVDHYTLYFAIAFDRPFASYGMSADNTYAHLTFTGETAVRLKPAISYVSIENALTNLAAEGASWDLDSVRAAARSTWNTQLDRVQVSGGSPHDLAVFYTALYHAFFHPNLFSDANGEYIGFDDQVHRVSPGRAHYHNVPGWDQYRSLVQLRSLLAPDQMSDIIQSLVDDAQQGGGAMPRWEQANRNSAGMVGDSPGAYVSSAYAFGARDFALLDALAALDFGASDPTATSGGHLVREYLPPWVDLGYVPDQPSVSLEYAIDDFAIAQFARSLGRADLADKYGRRAMQWHNTFNPAIGYVESRTSTGQFAATDHVKQCCGFVEGNAAQYTWMVPFDVPGVVVALGGSDSAVRRLDDFFAELNAGPNRPHAWIGNQPSLWSPWAYTLSGFPSRTQAVVRRIQKALFTATPGGLPGNDDGGTTSAWYVFSALGLYPAIPGVGGFAVGSPVFESATIKLGSGAELRIIGRDAGPDRPYVRRLTVDGVDSTTSAWLEWSQLSSGATLEFWLDATP